MAEQVRKYFDAMYSSPLDRAVAIARGLGSVAAAL